VIILFARHAVRAFFKIAQGPQTSDSMDGFVSQKAKTREEGCAANHYPDRRMPQESDPEIIPTHRTLRPANVIN
jgi:hypothetical protein